MLLAAGADPNGPFFEVRAAVFLCALARAAVFLFAVMAPASVMHVRLHVRIRVLFKEGQRDSACSAYGPCCRVAWHAGGAAAILWRGERSLTRPAGARPTVRTLTPCAALQDDTVLTAAVEGGSPALVALLLGAGADANKPNQVSRHRASWRRAGRAPTYLGTHTHTYTHTYTHARVDSMARSHLYTIARAHSFGAPPRATGLRSKALIAALTDDRRTHG